MRIAFICGSLESGRDGVGDYVQRLAKELVKRGHEVLAIGLNDKYVSTHIEYSEGGAIHKLRIPSFSLMEGRDRVRSKIFSFDPDWISLQYVPFSFQKKGLPYNLADFVAVIAKTRKIHIMFHELWVGMDLESGLKYKVWGRLQQRIVKNLIKKLKPNIIHTSNQLYQKTLALIDVQAEILKLFGNIPLTATRSKDVNDECVKLVIFGGIHHGAAIEVFAQEVAMFAKRNNIEITLLFIGRCGREQIRWADTWKAKHLPFHILGEQPESIISELLANATAGISTTPIMLIEKSGSVAAMLEHGLPVLCVARNWKHVKVSDSVTPEGIIEYHEGNFGSLLLRKKEPLKNGVSIIADQLLTKMLI